jgi:transposase-like protein
MEMKEKGCCEMAKQETMTLLEFQKKFNTEEACEAHLFQIRRSNGFVCLKCGHNEHFNIKSRRLFQCKHCNHQTSVTAGTIMENTQLPLVKWFWAMFLMGEDKRGCSALYLSKQLGIAYSTAWAISHIQSYLDEFCFRFNRRFFSTQLFNRAVNTCAFSSPISYSELMR